MIGKKIKKLRGERGWTQGELAKKSGLSRTIINLIENNNVKNPQTITITKIANAFKIPFDYLSNEKIEIDKYIVKESKLEYEYPEKITQVLKDFINSQEFMLMQITEDEIDHLKSFRFNYKKPTKQFYIDALFKYRNLESR